MAYNIRPLSFAEVLDRSLRILVDNAVVLIGISAIVFVPNGVLQGLGKGWPQVASLILLMVVAPLVQAAITTAIADIYLDRPTSIARAYRSGWSILLPFFGTYLLIYGALLLVVLIFGVVMGIGFLVGVKLGPLSVIIAILVGVPLWFYLFMRWSLLGPVMIVERRFGLSAFRRSSALVDGVWWRTFGILIVAGLIAQVPLGALRFLWSSLPVVGVLLSGLASAISSTYAPIAIVVYYFDRRCRTEDFDLRHLAEQIRSEGPQGSPARTGDSSLV